MQSMNNTEHPGRAKTRPAFAIGAAVVILIIIAWIFASHSRVPPLSAARLASDPSLGNPAAKVTIIEYGDFGCPTCRGWEKAGVLKQILAAYGDQVHFIWRDYPIITAQSPQAAEAGQCAFEQGKFWDYHDLLYAKAPALSMADLKSYAAQLGLHTAQFDLCIDTGQDQAKVNQSINEARLAGFFETPSFLVNGQKLIGPASFDKFKSLIDPLLAGG
jgi:protein-disulfide isomerase